MAKQGILGYLDGRSTTQFDILMMLAPKTDKMAGEQAIAGHHFKIRFVCRSQFSLCQLQVPYSPLQGPTDYSVYENSGFVKVQAVMDRSIMAFLKNDSSFVLDYTPVCFGQVNIAVHRSLSCSA